MSIIREFAKFIEPTGELEYDNTTSGLSATTIKSAIDELNTLLGGGNVGSQSTFSIYEFAASGGQTTFNLSSTFTVGGDVTAGDFITNETYKIQTTGTTDFTLIGASDSNPGTVFTATGAGAGTGTARVAVTYIPGYIQVYINGVFIASTDYTASDGQTVVLTEAAEASDLVTVVVLDSFNVATQLRVINVDASAPDDSLVIDNVGDVSVTSDIKLADNGKLILGDSSDLQIYSDGTTGQVTGNVNVTGSVTADGLTVDTDTLVVDATNNRVGIGTSSPEFPITAYGSSNQVYIGSVTPSVKTVLASDETNLRAYIGTRTNHPISFVTDGNERMRIDISGQTQVVGFDAITLGFPAVAGGASRSGIKPTVTGAGAGQLQFLVGGDNITEATTIAAMLDASGNLLVGKSATAFGTAGVEASASSGLWSTRSGFPPLALNRLSTDGSIADFYEDGAPVGSIFNSGTTMGVGSLDTGVLLANNIDAILPWNASTNAERDNAIDLGRSAGRFKDLYLSGGVEMIHSSSGGIQMKRYDSTININNSLGQIVFGGSEDGGTTVNNSASIVALSSQNHTSTASGGYLTFNTTADNTTTLSERMRITAAGALQLSDVNSPNDINTAIYSNSDVLEFEAFGTNGAIAFATGSSVTERMRIDEFGGLAIKSVGGATTAGFYGGNLVNGITAVPSGVGTPFVLGRDTGTLRSAHFGGNLKFDSGYGVLFGDAGGSGSSSSNTLDSYEEGTWTPTVVGGTSGLAPITVVTANYTKVGNKVFAACYIFPIDLSTDTIVGPMRIGGLPFSGASRYTQAVSISYQTISTAYPNLSGYVQTNQIILNQNTTTTTLDRSDCVSISGRTIMIGVTYITA